MVFILKVYQRFDMFSQVPVLLHASAGADFSKTFYMKNDDYSPRNLEGCVISGAMAKHPKALNADLSTSTEPVWKIIPLNANITNPVGGSYSIGFDASTSMGLEEGKYFYNVVLLNIDGTREEVLSGVIFIDVAIASFT